MKWIYGTTFSFLSLKKIFCSRICSLIWILFRPAPSSSTRRQRHYLAVRSPTMLLFDVSVKSGIWKVLFVTIFTVEISSPIIIFWSSFSWYFYSIWGSASWNIIVRVWSIFLRRSVIVNWNFFSYLISAFDLEAVFWYH